MEDVFRALADPTRRRVLQELQKGERSAGELGKLFSTSQANLSGHLKILKAADLVATRKRSTHVMYRLNTSVFQETLQAIVSFFQIEDVPFSQEVKNEPSI